MWTRFLAFLGQHLRNILKNIIWLFMFLVTKNFSLHNRVVFKSHNGISYNDNPKYISDEVFKQYPDIPQIWIIDRSKIKTIQNSVFKLVMRNSINEFYYLATSKIWVDCSGKLNRLYKRKDQVYINTWHGDRGIKKVVYLDNRFLELTKNIEKPVFEEHACDVMIAGSNYGIKRYRQAFRYKGAILNIGCPRNDALIHPSEVNVSEIKKQLGIPKSQKILLYAPTFRKEYQFMNSNDPLDFSKVLNILENVTKEPWIILLRYHFSEKYKLNNIQSTIDVTNYPEMNDLLLVSDFLISDYSSCVGDYLLLKRPLLLYHNDVNNYLENERGLNINLKESGYVVANTFQQLEAILYKYCELDWVDISERILDFYGTFESGISTKVCSSLINALIKETNKDKYQIIFEFKERYDAI